MKMCKTISVFILMFTGYLCNGDELTTSEMVPTKGLSPPLEDHDEASKHNLEWETKPDYDYQDSPPGTTPGSVVNTEERQKEGGNLGATAEHLLSVVVAGVSISLVFLFIIIITVFWYVRKKSKESSAEINSVLYTEPGVSLKNISMNENHPEWPFERALH